MMVQENSREGIETEVGRILPNLHCAVIVPHRFSNRQLHVPAEIDRAASAAGRVKPVDRPSKRLHTFACSTWSRIFF